MKAPWNFISPWSLSAIDAGVQFPVTPIMPVDELRRELVPTIVAQTSSRVPALPIPSGALEGGLLAPLNAGRSGGLLGGLAAPVEQLDSANYWGIGPTPSRTIGGPMLGSDYYLSSMPPAPSWGAVPTRALVGATEFSPKPPSRWSWSAPARDPHAGPSPNGDEEGEGVRQTLSDITSDNYWIPGADYAGEGHHEFPQALYKRMPPETQKVFDRATTGHLYLGFDNRRHEYDSFHREYNRATGELLKRFMGEQNISEPEQMTPIMRVQCSKQLRNRKILVYGYIVNS
jgi:hypothetical protein